MPRTKGSKNKNINTAKNKNIININVNSSKSKKGRGRPKKTTNNTNTQARYPNAGGINAMAPPQVIITQPPADNSNNNSLLSSFITSKMLNETMNLNRSNISNVEPTRTEQPSYFNARESIIPKLPDTPEKTEIKKELKPTVEIKPAVVKQKELTPYDSQYQQARTTGFSNMSASQKKKYERASQKDKDEFEEQIRNRFDDMYNGSTIVSKTLKDVKKKDDIMKKVREQTALLKKKKQEKEFDDKIQEGLNESEAAYEREISKLENQVKEVQKKIKPKQQSTTDFLNMSFSPPKKDIVEMMTPSKDTSSTAIIPYRENRSLLDFAIGGSPAKIKTAQEIKEDKMKARLTELKKKKNLNTQELFELNDLKSHFTFQPNPNKKIASGIVQRIAKSKLAQNELVDKKIDESIKQQKQREDAFERIRAASKRKLTKQYVDAKKELKSKDTGEPLVVNQQTKQLILKKNRDRGLKAQQAAATKKRNVEQEKIINFAKFMLEQNGVNPYSGLRQTNI